MDRRTFVGAGAAALASLVTPKLLQGQSCANPTQPDRYGYGPFYLSNAPGRIKLAADAEPGEKLSLSGTVSNCAGPVSGIKLEAWHATDSGCYKYPGQTCPDLPGISDTYRLRGYVVTDAQGKYAIDTIKPGIYLNGARYRPSHIHFRITNPATAASGALDLVTQLYFQGDPWIIGDIGADDPSAAGRIIPLQRASTTLPWQGTFNVIIPGGTTGLGTRIDPWADPAMRNFDVVMEKRGKDFLFHVPSLNANHAVEFRLYDATGSLLQRELQNANPLRLDSNGLRRGTYIAEIRWWVAKGMRKESITLHV